MTPAERADLLDDLAQMLAAGTLTLGGVLRVLRISILDMDRKAFADVVKMSERQVAKLEDDVANPTLDTITRVFGVFGYRFALLSTNQRLADTPAARAEKIQKTLARTKRARRRV